MAEGMAAEKWRRIKSRETIFPLKPFFRLLFSVSLKANFQQKDLCGEALKMALKDLWRKNKETAENGFKEVEKRFPQKTFK